MKLGEGLRMVPNPRPKVGAPTLSEARKDWESLRGWRLHRNRWGSTLRFNHEFIIFPIFQFEDGGQHPFLNHEFIHDFQMIFDRQNILGRVDLNGQHQVAPGGFLPHCRTLVPIMTRKHLPKKGVWADLLSQCFLCLFQCFTFSTKDYPPAN